MKMRITGLAAAAVLMLSCTTQRPESPREPPQLLGSVTQSIASRFLQPPRVEGFKACQLGTTCLTLDPRPFELCLVGTKRCAEKATEPLLVIDELVVTPAEQH